MGSRDGAPSFQTLTRCLLLKVEPQGVILPPNQKKNMCPIIVKSDKKAIFFSIIVRDNLILRIM